MDYTNVKTAILGSTGSVGTQAIDALSQFGAEITMLAAGKSYEKLIDQAPSIIKKVKEIFEKKTVIEETEI